MFRCLHRLANTRRSHRVQRRKKNLAIAICDRLIAVELRHLEYFVAVAAELNFSRAAERIHVVQSALSASVGKLEKELGVELFDRSKRQITLTAAGEAFLTHAREVLHTVQVERNGFIHCMVAGTAEESKGYDYYGPRAYAQWISAE